MVSVSDLASKRGFFVLSALCLICGASCLPRRAVRDENGYPKLQKIIQYHALGESTQRQLQSVLASPDGMSPDVVPISSPPPSPPPRPPHTDLPPVETIGQQTPNQKNLKWYLIGGIAGGGLLLVIIIIITCCCICAAHRREAASNSVRPVKTVSKPDAKDKEKEKEEKKKLKNDDEEVPVHPAARAALLAAQQERTNTLHGRSGSVASPRPTAGSASTAPTASSSAGPAAASSSQSASKAKEPAQPDATVALRALNANRPTAQAVFPDPPVVVDMKPLDSSSESSSSETRSSEESEEEESEGSTTQSSSDESSEEGSSLSSESRSEESGPKLNFDPDHVDEEGFDDW